MRASCRWPKTKAVQLCLDQFGRQFAVRRVDREQTASHYALRCSALVDVDMSRVGTHHGMVRAAHGVDVQHIGSRTVKYEIHLCLGSKNLLEQLFGLFAILVVAVCQGMFDVGGGYCLHDFGADARMVVTTKSASHKK